MFQITRFFLRAPNRETGEQTNKARNENYCFYDGVYGVIVVNESTSLIVYKKWGERGSLFECAYACLRTEMHSAFQNSDVFKNQSDESLSQNLHTEVLHKRFHHWDKASARTLWKRERTQETKSINRDIYKLTVHISSNKRRRDTLDIHISIFVGDIKKLIQNESTRRVWIIRKKKEKRRENTRYARANE